MISMLDVYEMLRDTKRAYGSKPIGPPDFDKQMRLAFT
jgi:hypothetical protein